MWFFWDPRIQRVYLGQNEPDWATYSCCSTYWCSWILEYDFPWRICRGDACSDARSNYLALQVPQLPYLVGSSWVDDGDHVDWEMERGLRFAECGNRCATKTSKPQNCSWLMTHKHCWYCDSISQHVKRIRMSRMTHCTPCFRSMYVHVQNVCLCVAHWECENRSA